MGIFRSLSDILNHDILTNSQKGFMRKCPLYMRPKRCGRTIYCNDLINTYVHYLLNNNASPVALSNIIYDWCAISSCGGTLPPWHRSARNANFSNLPRGTFRPCNEDYRCRPTPFPLVDDTISAGQTLMVRWIASEG